MDTLEVNFSNGKFVGEIFIDIKINDQSLRIEASVAFPPFEDFIQFLEDVLSNRLPASFKIDEEGTIKEFSSVETNDPDQIRFIISPCSTKNKHMEGVFNKKQFVLEFFDKFTSFLSNKYDKNKWIIGSNSPDLKRISLDKLKRIIAESSQI